MRTQNGLPLERSKLGIRQSMQLINEWLTYNFGAKRDYSTIPESYFWNELKEPTLFTWWDIKRICGGVGPGRLWNMGQLKDEAFKRSAAYQWYVKGKQKDFSYYSDPSYAYFTLFCYAVVTQKTIATEAVDISKDGLFDKLSIFLAGGTIWEAENLIRRGARFVTVSNYETPQVDFYRWVSGRVGISDKVKFVNQNAVPFSHEILIANEYLEHYHKPTEELVRLIDLKPARVYHRSSFCFPAHGHPIPITINGNMISDHDEADEMFDNFCGLLKHYDVSPIQGVWNQNLRKNVLWRSSIRRLVRRNE